MTNVVVLTQSSNADPQFEEHFSRKYVEKAYREIRKKITEPHKGYLFAIDDKDKKMLQRFRWPYVNECLQYLHNNDAFIHSPHDAENFVHKVLERLLAGIDLPRAKVPETPERSKRLDRIRRIRQLISEVMDDVGNPDRDQDIRTIKNMLVEK
jgi:hypothetical protein